VKWPCSESLTASANACACQGSANTGPSSSRGRRSKFKSGVLKVVVPHVDVNRIPRRGLLAPHLARGEAHRVHVLALFASEVSHGVGEHVYAMIAIDRSYSAARVTRQSRVSGRIEVARADALAHAEQGRHPRVPARR